MSIGGADLDKIQGILPTASIAEIEAIVAQINANVETSLEVGVIRSVQRGTRTGSGTVAISNVDVSKSILLTSGTTAHSVGGSSWGVALTGGVAGQITSSTSIQIINNQVKVDSSNATGTTYWQVIEFH